MFKILFFTLFLTSNINLYAHSGKKDATGGHFKLKDTYHCHSPSCIKHLKLTYNRKDWKHWSDSDCQNTRAEILIRDSKVPVTFKKNKQCLVVIGQWLGVYTGKIFNNASDLDIDHIVALQHAHITGGALWSKDKKRIFANDIENLLPVDDTTNIQKGAKSPDKWKPPHRTYWCRFARKWTHIKIKYKLHISLEEQSALLDMFKTCY